MDPSFTSSSMEEWISCQTADAGADSAAAPPEAGDFVVTAPMCDAFSALLAADAAADGAARTQAAAAQRAERGADAKRGFDKQMAMSALSKLLNNSYDAAAASTAATDAAEALAQPAKRLRGDAPANALVASNLPPIVAPPRPLGSGGARANRLGSLYDPLNRHTPKPAWYVRAPPAAKDKSAPAA